MADGLFGGLGLDQPSGGVGMASEFLDWINRSTPGSPRIGMGPTAPPIAPPMVPPQVGRAGREGDLDAPVPITPGSSLRSTQDLPPIDVGAALRGGGAGGPTSLGGPGGPTPLTGPGSTGDITLGGPGGPTPFSPPGAAAKKPSIADALKGVKMPAGPELQKLSTPAAPRPTTQIRGGDLQALLLALNAGGGGAPPMLGKALGR